MTFLLLVLGVALWTGAHLFKRLAPDLRQSMGDAGRAAVAIALLAAIVLMVIGYKQADHVAVWYPAGWGYHLNNLLVLVGFYVFGIGMAKGALSQRIRHPMLTGTVLWAIAHLLVRGDLASLILFGGLGLWAIAAMLIINAREPGWTPPPPKGGWTRDLVALPIVLVTYAVVGLVHRWLDVNPFGAM